MTFLDALRDVGGVRMRRMRDRPGGIRLPPGASTRTSWWLRPRRSWRRPRRTRRPSRLGGLGGRGGLLVGLLALDAGLGLGLGELGLEGLLGDGLRDVDDEGVLVGDEGRALGQLDGAGEDLRAGREALDRDDDVLGDVGREDLELEGVVVERDDRLGSGLALEVHGDVDGDLLALADDDEVDVVDDRLDRVALHVLGEGELLGTVDDDGEQGVGLLERHHRVVARQRDVHGVGAVAVHDGGDVAGAADLAGGALAEVGALLGGELGAVGHGSLLKIGG